MATQPAPQSRTLVDERVCALSLNKSIGWLRKDRLTKRIVPFVRVGASIRYDLDRVHASFAEEGGPKARA